MTRAGSKASRKSSDSGASGATRDVVPGVDGVTQLLASWREGDPDAVNALFPLVYRELRALARRKRRGGSTGETLRTTALVHEAYLKLADHAKADIRDRQHFFALASRVMRQVLVDACRRRNAEKRGGAASQGELDDTLGTDVRTVEVLILDQALERLARLDARLCQIVELRVFSGLTVEEIAELIGTSPRTVKRDWRKARAFLVSALGSGRAIASG